MSRVELGVDSGDGKPSEKGPPVGEETESIVKPRFARHSQRLERGELGEGRDLSG